MLQRLTNALAAVTLVAASFALNAQSIDLGRGELPITVPAGYSSENPAPLIVSVSYTHLTLPTIYSV